MTGFESFAARLQQDQRLQHRLGRLEGETRDEIVRGIAEVAGEAGFELSSDELNRAIGGSSRSGELDAQELAKMSGGGAVASDQVLAAAVMGKLGKRARLVLAG